MSLDEKFNVACTKVKEFKQKPSDDELLQLYSLYKQATIGDVNIKKPSDFKGKAKWDAWNNRKGLPSNEAKSAYVDVYETLSIKYM